VDVQVIKLDELPASNLSHDFVGADHGDTSVSMLFVDAAPGAGPSLHKHPYEELFILLEGEATFIAGDQEVQIGAGHMVVVPPGTPHAFTNTGSGRLWQIDVHVSPKFQTEWL
jgi:mannose-6-phosphate isomerase-like protein (cupin superfamily)